MVLLLILILILITNKNKLRLQHGSNASTYHKKQHTLLEVAIPDIYIYIYI